MIQWPEVMHHTTFIDFFPTIFLLHSNTQDILNQSIFINEGMNVSHHKEQVLMSFLKKRNDEVKENHYLLHAMYELAFPAA